jgi:hypothetical protein
MVTDQRTSMARLKGVEYHGIEDERDTHVVPIENLSTVVPYFRKMKLHIQFVYDQSTVRPTFRMASWYVSNTAFLHSAIQKTALDTHIPTELRATLQPMDRKPPRPLHLYQFEGNASYQMLEQNGTESACQRA